MAITIAVDAMGGDHGPEVTVPGSIAALAQDHELNLILVGKQDQINEQLNNLLKGF